MSTIHAHDSAPATRIRSAPVVQTIRQAAQKSGVSFSYLLSTAQRESGLDPAAKAKTSSATGLYQFIDQTWLGMVARHGDKHGLGAAADAITQGKNGRYEIADPETRSAVLALRNDPVHASAMAGEYARESADRLEAGLGRTPSDGELYAAHFLGAGGALTLIGAKEQSPELDATALFPEAAKANRAIFYDGDRSRSVSEVFDKVAKILPGGEAGQGDPGPGPDVPFNHAHAAGRPQAVPAQPSKTTLPPAATGYLLSPEMITALAILDPLAASKS